jgi:hypothetical protein
MSCSAEKSSPLAGPVGHASLWIIDAHTFPNSTSPRKIQISGLNFAENPGILGASGQWSSAQTEIYRIAEEITKYCLSPEAAVSAAMMARPDLYAAHDKWIKEHMQEEVASGYQIESRN